MAKFARINFRRTRISRLSSSTVRSYRRMLSWFSLSLYIYIYIICVYRYRPVHPLRSRARTSPSPSVPFLISFYPPPPLYANNVFTLGDSGCTIFALVGIAFARRTGNTVSLFVILILLSRDSVHSGIKRTSSGSLRRPPPSSISGYYHDRGCYFIMRLNKSIKSGVVR